MTFSTLIKHSALAAVVGTATLVAGGTAQAASINFNNWTRVGDAIAPALGSATITNAFDDLDDAVNANVSGNPAVFADDLEAAIGLPTGALGNTVQEGSAFVRTVNPPAGNALIFNYAFAQLDTQNGDFGFVSINDDIFQLDPSQSSFVRALNGTAPFTIAFGVVDNGDTVDSSVLQISNARIVPTPALLPGIIGLAAGVIRKRKQETAE